MVLLGLLRAGARLLGLGKRLCSAVAPLLQLLWEHAVLAAPGTAGRLVQRRSADHRFKPSGSCPRTIHHGLGQCLGAPALERIRRDAHIVRHRVQRSALRRQQPGHRAVLECLSVSSQFVLCHRPRVHEMRQRARLWICGRCASRTGQLAVDNAAALPTAPTFAHKLHSLTPPLGRTWKSKTKFYRGDNYSECAGRPAWSKWCESTAMKE
jgi:hypothetical protein